MAATPAETDAQQAAKVMAGLEQRMRSQPPPKAVTTPMDEAEEDLDPIDTDEKAESRSKWITIGVIAATLLVLGALLGPKLIAKAAKIQAAAKVEAGTKAEAAARVEAAAKAGPLAKRRMEWTGIAMRRVGFD